MDRQNQIDVVNTWLRDLSKSLGVELTLNNEGVCFFQIGENVAIGIELSNDNSMVNIFSPFLSLPSDNKDLATVMLTKALELNAFQVITRGGSIAIPPGGGPFMYCYSTPVEGGSSEILSGILGGFYETIPELKRLMLEPPTKITSEKSPQAMLQTKNFIKI